MPTSRFHKIFTQKEPLPFKIIFYSVHILNMISFTEKAIKKTSNSLASILIKDNKNFYHLNILDRLFLKFHFVFFKLKIHIWPSVVKHLLHPTQFDALNAPSCHLFIKSGSYVHALVMPIP